MGKLTLLLLLGWLQYSLWLGKKGVHALLSVENDVADNKTITRNLKSKMISCFSEIDGLNSGQEAIDKRSRNDLGIIKPGETFYRLVPENAHINETCI